MEIKEIKACPLLGCHEQENTVFEKALGIASTEIVLEAYETCITFPENFFDRFRHCFAHVHRKNL